MSDQLLCSGLKVALAAVQIAFHGEAGQEVSQHQVRLPRDSCVEQLLAELQRQLPASHASAPLRLLELYMSKIFKVCC